MKIVKVVSKVLAASLFTAAIVVGFSSCGEKKSRVKTNEKGEILELCINNQSETGEYDPAGAAAFVYFSHQTYALDPLVDYTKDGLYTPATAESWEVSKDLLTYTFHIRKNAKWSDGSDVTSYDYKNTMVRALEPANGSWYVDFLFPIKNAKAAFDGKTSLENVGIATPDAKTIVFTLEAPCAYFLDLLPNVPTFRPSSKKYAKDEDKNWDMIPGKNLSNGPWYMAERKPGEYILYKKNPYYYDAEKVNLLSIRMRFMDDDQAKAAAYQTGELTILSGAAASIADAYEGKPDVRFVEIPQTNYIMLNPNVAPFDNPLVRKAFALAVKRSNICTVVGKSCMASTTLVGRFYKSKVDGTQWGKLQGELLKEDLAEAKKLLAEAGFPEGKGLPKITYTYPSMNYEGDVAQILQQQWKELGVEVELRALENEVYVATRREAKSQAIRMQWYADYNDPTSWLMMYVKGNSLNDIRYDNPKYNELMAKSDLELDVAKRQALLVAAEKLIVSEDTCIVPLFTNNTTSLTDPSLTNFYYDVIAYPNYKQLQVKQ
ncbi:MAG: peptide ABC transporter substrate-binding protein [Treponema sp.]|nr:peptide ABC transporter substrate-binding protein [Candidatus Treponema equifaecale]